MPNISILKNKFTPNQINMLNNEERTKAQAFNDAFDAFYSTPSTSLSSAERNGIVNS